jgi:hypothetical protein
MFYDRIIVIVHTLRVIKEVIAARKVVARNRALAVMEVAEK